MNKQRIAFIIPSLNAGGAERVMSTLSNSLVSNFNITIIVLYQCDIFYDLDKSISVIFCENTYNSKRSAINRIISHIKFIRIISSIVKSNEIELLIGFMTTTNLYAIAVSKINKVPCIISERIHPDYSPISEFVKKVRKNLYRFTDLLVVQTNDIAQFFSTFVNAKKIKVIYNPLNPDLISNKNNTILKENIILNVGRLDYQKNQDMLIRAFANINNKNWKLIIVGEGIERDNYNRLINELDLESKIELTGNITDIERLYNMSSIFAFTSRFEGFPNALTEAMAFGLACIATNCPSGPSELIIDGQNGYLIDSEDQAALEQKLSCLMNNENIRSNFSYESIKNMEKFEIENISEQWHNLITNLI